MPFAFRVGKDYFLAAWLRLEAFSGLSFFSSFLTSDFRCVAKLQRPSVHLDAGFAKTEVKKDEKKLNPLKASKRSQAAKK